MYSTASSQRSLYVNQPETLVVARPRSRWDHHPKEAGSDFFLKQVGARHVSPKIPSSNHNSTNSLPAIDEKRTTACTSENAQQQQPLRSDLFKRFT